MSKIIPAIRVENFSFYYDTQKIIEDVSLDIPQNKITAIMYGSKWLW
jgi:phosphate transport system ATP-binding protein